MRHTNRPWDLKDRIFTFIFYSGHEINNTDCEQQTTLDLTLNEKMGLLLIEFDENILSSILIK